MAEWWMQSGTTSTEPGANGPVMVGSCAILGTGSVGTGEIADSAVTVAKLGALSVTSEKASANLKQRSVVITIPMDAAKGVGWGSTSVALWTAPVPVVLTGIRVAPMTPWEFTTSGEGFEFWSCTAGYITTYCTTSTAVCKTIGDVNSCFTLISTGTNLAACETVRVSMTLDSCSNLGLGLIQIDYLTSG